MIHTGWIPDEPKKPGEKPDWQFSATQPLKAIDGDLFEPIRYVLGVLNQGPMPTCVAHSVAQQYRMECARAGLQTDLLSRWFLHFVSRAVHADTARNGGTYFRTMYQAVRDAGAPSEKYYPYKVDSQPRWQWQPPTLAYQKAADHKRDFEYRSLMHLSDDERLLAVDDLLNRGKAVAGGWTLSDSWVRADFVKGPAQAPKEGEPTHGNHAFLIVARSGDGDYKFLNSWGSGYGEAGYGWMTPDYVLQGRDLRYIEVT